MRTFVLLLLIGLAATQTSAQIAWSGPSIGFPGLSLATGDGEPSPFLDCNGNGVEDAVDIGNGTSTDTNKNGIPDDCESLGTPFCLCPAGVPAGDTDPAAGCSNSTGAGALLSGSGGASVAADDLELTVTGLPPRALNVLFMGPASTPPRPFGEGLRCVGGPRYSYAISGASATGTSVHLGVVTFANSTFPLAGNVVPGSTWHFQDVYRDQGGPGRRGWNLSSALSITFQP